MFRIACQNNDNNYTIYDPRTKEFAVTNPVLELGLNKIGGLTFDIYTSHPHIDTLEKMVSILTVYRDEKIIFKGRVISTTQNLDTSVHVDCEGLLGYLNDSIKRPFNYKKSASVPGTSNHFLERLLVDHNSQVGSKKEIKKGIFGHSKPYEVDESGYRPMWELVENLISNAGGFLRTRYESDGVYLDYRGSYPNELAPQKIRTGTNVLNLTRKVSGEEMATVVIPIGKDNINIKSVNNNLDYVESTQGIAHYGRIVKMVDFPNITDKNELKTAGLEHLEKSQNLGLDFEIEAVDLNLTNDSIAAFDIGQTIEIDPPQNELSEPLMLKELTINLADLQTSTIRIGDQSSVFVDIISHNNNADRERAAAIASRKSQIYVQEDEPDELARVPQNLWIDTTDGVNTPMVWIEEAEEWQPKTDIVATIAQETAYIIKNIDIPQLEDETRVQMELQDRKVDFNFSQIKDDVSGVQDDLNEKFQEVDAYIRFIDGNIILGRLNSPFSLEIKNNRISFLQNEVEVAHISNNKLNIVSGEFLNMLKIGSFAFFANASGSLSLERVK